VKSETVGNFYSVTMIEQISAADPFWQTAVQNNRRVAIA
jgi:hypothetical protein